MKRLISGGLSALLLATATGTMAATGAMAAPVPQSANSAMVFNFTAPMITNSGTRNDTHFIQVAVIGMSLQDLVISVPEQMKQFNKIRITDQSGAELNAKTQLTKNVLTVTFAQPVAPGTYVNVEFAGVQMGTVTDGSILLYEITGRRVGLRDEIPIGTARIQIPSRS